MSKIVSVHDAKESIDPSTLPIPNYSHISDLIIVHPPRWIPFSDIWIDSDSVNDSSKGNRARYEGTTPERVSKLETSFGMGVDSSQEIPAVIDRNADAGKPWELLYGFGRTESLRNMLGHANGGWFYTPIEAPEWALEWICLFENEILPKSTSKEVDISQVVTRLIERGEISNTQKKISAAIQKNLPFREKESRDRIVQAVMKRVNTPQKFVYYNKGKAEAWKQDHSKDEFIEVGGALDELRQKYGFLVKEGSLYRFFHNAIRKYALTGKSSYAVLHVGEPTENVDIPTKRANQVIEFETLKKHYETCGMKTHFMSILGALPQEVGIDNWKELISV